jgi:5-methylcytosine-specific restriction endonuclease McrA
MARSKGHVGRPWRRIREEILKDSPPCYLCGLPGADSVDHVLPISLGGPPLDPDNLRPAHIRCNSKRGNRLNVKPPLNTSEDWFG